MFRRPTATLAAVIAVIAVFVAAAGPAAATAADSHGTAVTDAAWHAAIAAAKVVKTDSSDPYYQYPLIGNGGLSLMPGPTGFTDVQPPGAPYAPLIGSDSWWNASTDRVLPFNLAGGYQASGSIAPGSIDKFTQTLDVGSGTLTSALELTPPTGATGGTAPFSSVRTEFVTPSGVLVIRVSDSSPHTFAVQIGEQSGGSYTASASALVATASGAGPSGSLALALQADGTNVNVDRATGTISVDIGPDQPATFYLASAGVDSPDPDTAASTDAGAAANGGYQAAADATTNFWSNFWGASSVAVPDPTLLKWYVRGQYYLGSLMAGAHVPPGVSGPTGEYNGDSDLEYDGVYDTLAMLTANEPAVAKVTADWVEKSLPTAEALAPFYTFDGSATPDAAKYPWLGDFHGTEDSQFGPTPLANDWEAYPSANAAMLDLLQAQYTNDSARMQRAEHVLQEVTQYQLDNSAREPALGDDWVNQKFCCGLPQGFVVGSVGDQAGLEWSLRTSAALGVGPAVWRTYADQVYMPTAFDRTRGEEVMGGFVGDAPSISNQAYLSVIPWYFYRELSGQSPLANPTLANLIGAPVLGDTLMRGNAAVAADVMGQGNEALRLLQYMTGATSAADASTADLWDDTYFSEGGDCSLPGADCAPGPSTTPNISGHSSFDQAIQYMLFDGESDSSITVFPALPSAWERRGASFTDLAANGDLEVSGSYSEAGTSVTVSNNGPTTATRTLLALIPADATRIVQVGGAPANAIADGRFASIKVSIAPGETQTVTLTPVARGNWKTADDADPRIGYSSGWSTLSGQATLESGTAHETIQGGATAALGFSGTAVRVVGDCNTDHGQFMVSIDGRRRGWYDAWCDQLRHGVTLFEADDLAPGAHSIAITASSLQDVQATGQTDPETGQTEPTDLFTLDAVQYGTFGVSFIGPQPASSAGDHSQSPSLPAGPAGNSTHVGTAKRAPASAHVDSIKLLSGPRLQARLRCRGSSGDKCVVALKLWLVGFVHRGRVEALVARAGDANATHARRTVVLGTARVTVAAGKQATVRLRLTAAASRLIVAHGHVLARLSITQLIGARRSALIGQTVRLAARQTPGKRKRAQ